jgi:two-component system, NarL family, response regulator NreC
LSSFYHVLKSKPDRGIPASSHGLKDEVIKPMPGHTPILLADDHEIVREGFRALLERAGLNVVAEASNGFEAVSASAQHLPSIAILDISMPMLNGCDTCREIAKVSPKTQVIMLSVHTEEPFVAEALRAGAKAYVLKSRGATGLLEAIRVVWEGDVYLSPGIAHRAVHAFVAEDNSNDPLSSRERQVVQLIAEGMATKEIAVTLQISIKTAECHRNRIMQKLNLHDIAGVVRYAVRRGLTEA